MRDRFWRGGQQGRNVTVLALPSGSATGPSPREVLSRGARSHDATRPSHPVAALGLRNDPLLPLVEAARNGHVGALTDLLQRCSPALIVTARALLGPASPDLEDVVQESLLALAKGLSHFRRESSFLHYARRVTALHALMARRKNKKTVKIQVSITQSLDAAAEGPESVAEDADRRSKQDAMLQLLEAIPLTQAECIALRSVLGYSLAEIAAAQGVSVNTVRSRMRLAREALKERIESDQVLCDTFGVLPSRGIR